MFRLLSKRATYSAVSALCIMQQFSYADYAFDTKGFPTKSFDNLILSGVGMRRKNFYIVEVDVYQTALNLSTNSLAAAKKCMMKGAQSCALGDDLIQAIASAGKGTPGANVILKFVREVTKSQVVEAFNDAFVGLAADEINGFKAELALNVGDAGVKVGEEIAFQWINGKRVSSAN
jgi:hypothetical protein